MISIGDCAFDRCESLINITIPDSIKSIGNFAFFNCKKLTSVTIPDSVTSIGEDIFKGCEKLTNVTIPDGIIEEQKDISFLITDEYVSFFTTPTSECEGKSTGYIGSWDYPEIMETFKDKILRAYRALYNFRCYNGRKHVWAEMRDKYCNGRSYVHPDEMIEHLSEFDSREIIGFLYYCTIYKERFCDGIYGFYAKEGFIGRLLIRLKELSP